MVSNCACKQELKDKKKAVLDAMEKRVKDLSWWNDVTDNALFGNNPFAPGAAKPEKKEAEKPVAIPFAPEEELKGPTQFPVSKPKVYHFHPLAFVRQMRRMATGCVCQGNLTVEIFESIFGKNKLFTNKLGSVNMKNYPEVYNIDKEDFVDKINDILPKHGIDNCLRLAHFLAQSQHEAHYYGTTEEYATGDDYDVSTHKDRHDKYLLFLGDNASYAQYAQFKRNYNRYRECIKMENTEEGDGKKFKGKGLIQLTWKKNYRLFSEHISNPDVLTNPSLVASNIDYAILSALFHWERNNINKYADINDVFNVSRLVNLPGAKRTSQINGYKDRLEKTNAAISILNSHTCNYLDQL